MTSDQATGPVVVFVALQTENSANGGIASMGEIIKGLKQVRPILVTNRVSMLTDDLKKRGIEVHIVKDEASPGLRAAPIGSLRTYIRYFRVLSSVIQRSRAQVVHANDPLAYQLSFAAAKARRGTKLALSIRDTLDPDRSVPTRKYEWIAASSDHTFFLSYDMLERWRRVANFAEERSSAPGSIVDFESFPFSSMPMNERKVVLVSGVVCAKKGQLQFLETAAPQILADGHEIWLVGDCDAQSSVYAAKCKVLADSLGPNLRILGYQKNIAELMKQASVICVASRYEGLMRSMIEAMSIGRPVVSTDVASAREVLEIEGSEAGVVVPLDYKHHLSEQIIRLCNDPVLAAEMGRNGAAIARDRFNRETVIAHYETAYRSLI